jgi:hypothetical protein
MYQDLATPVSLLGRLGPWGPVKAGDLALANGVLTFTTRGGRKSLPGQVFAVPVEQVTVRFPRLYLGLGLQLTVRGKRYRFWFVSMRSAAGQTVGAAGGGGTIVVGNEFDLTELRSARIATRRWQAALGSPPAGQVLAAPTYPAMAWTWCPSLSAAATRLLIHNPRPVRRNPMTTRKSGPGWPGHEAGEPSSPPC